MCLRFDMGSWPAVTCGKVLPVAPGPKFLIRESLDALGEDRQRMSLTVRDDSAGLPAAIGV